MTATAEVRQEIAIEALTRRGTTADSRSRRRKSSPLTLIGTAAMLIASGVLFTAAGLLFFLHLSVQPVLTGSMRPTFGPGWVVISRSIPVSTVRPGMVVIFVPPAESASYAHRVVTVSGTPEHPVLTTKGDANPAPDIWHARLTKPRIQEVVAALPWLGTEMTWVKGHGLSTIVLVFAGLFIAITGARAISGLSRLAPGIGRRQLGHHTLSRNHPAPPAGNPFHL
jgi:signal peptidase